MGASSGTAPGGRQSFLAGLQLPVKAVIDCYGAFVVVDPPVGVSHQGEGHSMGEVDNLSAPLLGLFGADDTFPSPEQNEHLADAP